jgi:chemotaxis protein MotA
MDLATIIGVVVAFGLVLTAIFLGGGLGVFVDVPSLLIVVGGTIGAGLINFPLKTMLGAFKVAKHVMMFKSEDPTERIKQMVEFANKARREGALALEAELGNVQDKFMKDGVQLIVDGQEPTSIESIMTTEIDYLRDRHSSGADIFTTLAAFAPALGLIGTLIGLVQMLQNMDDPSKIGPSMAVALLTTFYGAVLANLVFTPMAGKLKKRASEEELLRELTLAGVLCIAAGDNPRLVEQKLKAFLAPKLRGEEAAA